MARFDYYDVPTLGVVPVDATAAKGAHVIDFTLKGGRIVQARRVALVVADGHALRATVLAWAAINTAGTCREALLLLAEDGANEPEVVAAAQRHVARLRAIEGVR